MVDIKLQEGQNVTTRYDRKRVIDVTADLSEKGNVLEIVEDLKAKVFKEIEFLFLEICIKVSMGVFLYLAINFILEDEISILIRNKMRYLWNKKYSKS